MPGRWEAEDTAIAWAAGRVLAVGLDDEVRSISRGDSAFLDVGGCMVTAIPLDLERAEAIVLHQPVGDPEVGSRLVAAGLLDPDSSLERDRQRTWRSGRALPGRQRRVPGGDLA